MTFFLISSKSRLFLLLQLGDASGFWSSEFEVAASLSLRSALTLGPESSNDDGPGCGDELLEELDEHGDTVDVEGISDELASELTERIHDGFVDVPFDPTGLPLCVPTPDISGMPADLVRDLVILLFASLLILEPGTVVALVELA